VQRLPSVTFMTDEGSEIRKKIQKSGGGVLDFLCDALDKGKDFVKDNAADAAGKVADIKDKVAGATQA
jgi:hypothetical protein